MNLRGKRILVTGASRGLGRAVTELLVERGAVVAATSRRPQTVDWLEGVRLFELDMATPETLAMTWERSGLAQETFDVVINNAGAGAFGEFAASDFAVWDAQVSLLLRAPVALCRFLLPAMIARGNGLIVNVSSLGVEYPIPFMSGYNSAKAALSSFSNALMSELSGTGVGVLDFRPGDFNSEFNDSAVRSAFSPERESVGNRVWQIVVSRMKASPEPEAIAETLVKALESDRSGAVRAGSFFQRVLAPLFARLVPLSVQRRANESYYRMNR